MANIKPFREEEAAAENRGFLFYQEGCLAWPFKFKCSSVAERYLLSRKETEVLFLLAKGHNSAYIQKALYISAGTANTHMRHIYRKLDVHSQQEVIEAVESEPIE